MADPLPSITEAFVCADYCRRCRGSGFVCEAHEDRPWYPVVSLEDGACSCGAPGMPCRPELRDSRVTFGSVYAPGP